MIATILLTVGCFLFYIFAFHLFITKFGNPFLNRLLGLLILARAGQITYILLFINDELIYFPFVVKVFNPFYFVAPAALFLYFKGFITDAYQLKKWEWLHFLPVLFAIVDMIPWFDMNSTSQQATIAAMSAKKSFFFTSKIGIVSHQTNVFLRACMYTIYVGLSWMILLKSTVFTSVSKNNTAKKWLLFLISITTLVQVITFAPFFSKYLFMKNHSDIVSYQYILVAISLLLLGSIIFVLLNPKILYGYAFVSDVFLQQENEVLAKVVLPEQSTSLTKTPATKKNNAIDKTIINNIYKDKILACMENEQPFLDADFTLQALSIAVNLQSYQCSYILNYVFKKTFREWTNEYRVAYFIQHYHNTKRAKTIEALALESGFRNKVTFYSAFLKINGVLPVEYFK
ncbi:hypothetical protein [Flavobacterium sp.]|uniref:helix-turn-helix domain-containing protein n=1 Tax=Flavobacterium sp. TaxID=239 RepID=UPI00248963FF|nr:hypothetical protein [Flavobacterium sp.]MDI1315852.1 hypothetical protein [Flavobacterium sp.]